MIDSELVAPKTVSHMIDAYNVEIENVKAAYKLLDEAEANLNSAFGVGGMYRHFSTLPRSYAPNGRTVDDVMETLHRQAWSNIINLMKVRQHMSSKRVDELDENLNHGVLPDLTEQNVFNMFAAFVTNTNGIVEELVKEAFTSLMPASYYRKNYKTNKKKAIGKKVILANYIDFSWRMAQVSHWRRQSITVIDKVFHLLDGKSLNDSYVSPLCDMIASGNLEGETEYFRYRCYQNGNLHLEFKRIDLVNEINRIGGDKSLTSHE